MPTQSRAASIGGVALRITRLDASSNLMTGPHDSYTCNSFLRVSFTPELEEGDEITEKGADGTVCVTYKAPDTLKRITFELAICEPDPEIYSLFGGVLLTKQKTPGSPSTAESVGWASPLVGENSAGNGVAIEAWSYAVAGGKRSSYLPYYHWIFPYLSLRPPDDRVLENGLLANTFSGEGLGNLEFQEGPDGRWEWPDASERPYSWARTDYAPTGICGWTQWNPTTGASTAVNTLTDTASFTNVSGEANYNSGASYDAILEAEDGTSTS